MAGSVNKVFLIGNLGRDPEIRRTQSGDRIATLKLATGESWTDKRTGERIEKTEWHTVSIMNDRLAEVAEKYLVKGAKVCVEGQLETSKWTDKDGVERYSTKVVIGRFRGELTILSTPRDKGDDDAAGSATRGTSPPAGRAPDLDDDIPF